MKVFQYGFIATLQLFLLVIDVLINTASEHFRASELHLLVLYMLVVNSICISDEKGGLLFLDIHNSDSNRLAILK